jgi:penicillin-binding protein 1A
MHGDDLNMQAPEVERPEEPRRVPRPGLRRWLALVAASLLGVATGLLAGFIVLRWGASYPEVEVLRNHRPKTFTRVYDRDGRLLDIFSSEKRILLDYADIPQDFVHALVAVEDEDFFQHFGVSPFGILSALKDNLLHNQRRGASTLTQQLVKNITKDARNSYERKFKEQLLAVQLEILFTKQEIFAMYANEIALGNNQFGIEAAARHYFGKSVGALTLPECATLAGIPQAPSRFNPFTNPEACTRRRNIVLDRMLTEGYLDEVQAANAKRAPLVLVDQRDLSNRPVAGHFVDKVREYLFAKYGEERVRSSGWDVHTTLDLDQQVRAEQALREGLRQVDKRQGFRAWDNPSIFPGPGAKDVERLKTYSDPSWRVGLQDGVSLRGLVMELGEDAVKVRVQSQTFLLGPEAVPWLKNPRWSQLAKVGDTPLFLVKALDAKAESQGPQTDQATKNLTLILDQEPALEGALVALDASNGDILAMVGGYDYARSKFNRAEQAKRQVGSAFKPFIYGAALENGFTLSDLLFDEPTQFVDPTQFFVDEAGNLQPHFGRGTRARQLGMALPQVYEPKNFYLKYAGSVTLRQAMAQSKNIVAVKLLNAIGYDVVLDYLQRFGLLRGNNLLPYPSMALGAFEMDLTEITSSYSAFLNQGVLMEPRFISLIADRKGQIIEQTPPKGEQVVSPENAFLVRDMLRSVVREPKGTAHAAARLAGDLMGKTGTTDDYTDAWFIGGGGSIICGVWVGHDVKQTIGRNATGGNTALPIFIDFIEPLMPTLPTAAPERPESIVEMKVDKITGKRMTSDCDCLPEQAFTEYYIKQTEPIELCRWEEQERAQLPWYLQKDRYQLQSGRVEPTRQFIDVESQKRALLLLEQFKRQKAEAKSLP